ncbi:hypothetical protein AB1484_19375 [Parafrankia sp. FMc6]|uniref:hypothetical protein n=1 Tax=Parafrankia soli TaxID=2599596 RepID=UPI0034D660B4
MTRCRLTRCRLTRCRLTRCRPTRCRPTLCRPTRCRERRPPGISRCPGCSPAAASRPCAGRPGASSRCWKRTAPAVVRTALRVATPSARWTSATRWRRPAPTSRTAR